MLASAKIQKVNFSSFMQLMEKGEAWIYVSAKTNNLGNSAVRHFVNKLNTDGNTTSRDLRAIYVYAYRKTAHTKP